MSQNGPVKRAHRIVSNGIKSCLISAGLPMAYWPFSFLHVLLIRNALPGNGQGSPPIHLSTRKKDNLKNLCTFGCRVWVRTPGIQAKRFKDKAYKVIFLGYVPTPHKTSSGTTLNLNDVKLLCIAYLTRDSTTSLLSLSTPMLSICFALLTEMKTKHSVDALSKLEFYIYPFLI